MVNRNKSLQPHATECKNGLKRPSVPLAACDGLLQCSGNWRPEVRCTEVMSFTTTAAATGGETHIRKILMGREGRIVFSRATSTARLGMSSR